MPYIKDEDWQKLLDRINVLEKDSTGFKQLTQHMRGHIVIQGSAGKKFDLNDNLNVILLLKRLTHIEDILGVSRILFITDAGSTMAGKYKFATDGDILRLYYSATGAEPWTDTGIYWGH